MALVLVPLQQGRLVTIDKAVLFFGRHPDCDVILNGSRKISRKHCCIAQVNDTLFLRDLGSLNGVHVNGERVERQVRIDVGDELLIGDVPYRLEQHRDRSRSKTPEARNGTGAKEKSRPTPPPPVSRPDDVSLDYPVALPEPGLDSDDEIIPLEEMDD